MEINKYGHTDNDMKDFTAEAKIAWFIIFRQFFGNLDFDDFVNRMIYKQGILDFPWVSTPVRSEFQQIISDIQNDKEHGIDFYEEYARKPLPEDW